MHILNIAFWRKKNYFKANQCLDKCFSEALFSETFKWWNADFKRDRTDKSDVERSSFPNSTFVSESINEVNEIGLDDHKMKLRNIAKELKIPEGSIFTVLHEHMSMRKQC